jgi:hypothetical protein
MRCENCQRKLGRSEIVSGIRYGTVDYSTDMFIPSRESAATIICQTCSKSLLDLIYKKLNKPVQLTKPRYHYR